MIGTKAIADIAAATHFPAELQGLKEEGNYLPKQIVNADGTELF